MVKSLQNTKYSIDEKLENSFITLFSRNPPVASDTQTYVSDSNEEQRDDTKPFELNELENQIEPDRSGEESDTEYSEGSESFDEDEFTQRDAMINGEDGDSDGGNVNASNHQTSLKDRLKEQVEFHDGRLRRKATFGDDMDDQDLMVIIAVTYLHF